MSRIMFGTRSKIKELVKLTKLVICNKSQLKSDDYFQNWTYYVLSSLLCMYSKNKFIKNLSQLEKYYDIYWPLPHLWTRPCHDLILIKFGCSIFLQKSDKHPDKVFLLCSDFIHIFERKTLSKRTWTGFCDVWSIS